MFTGEYDKPAVNQPVDMEANTTIAELAAMYETGKPWTVDKNIVISGIVSTTDRYGNFYKSFYIQDETGGMEIKLGKNGLYNDYLPGQRIYVDCNGLELGMYGYKAGSGNGMVQIGFNNGTDDTYETSYIESSILIDTHVFKGEVEGEVKPVELTVTSDVTVPDVLGMTPLDASSELVLAGFSPDPYITEWGYSTSDKGTPAAIATDPMCGETARVGDTVRIIFDRPLEE